MLHWTGRTRLLLALAAVLAAGAWTAPWVAGLVREYQLARAVPTLDPELRRHFARDSDRDWIAYCRRVGLEWIVGTASPRLLSALHSKDLGEFARKRGPTLAACLRLAEAIREIHRNETGVRATRRDMSLTALADFEQRKQERRLVELYSDSSLTVFARAQELDGIRKWFLAHGDSGRALDAAITAAYCEVEGGRGDRYAARLRDAVEMARRAGQDQYTCQLLGELGVVHRNAGREDSMRACYDEGIEIARSHDLVPQAARLLRFYAAFYKDEGRLALAVDRMAEAVRLADSTGGTSRMRFQIEYAKFLADQGCWDLVERSLRRMPPLLREFTARRDANRLRYEFDAELLRAQLALATGRVEEGVLHLQRLAVSVPTSARRVGLADVFDQWSLGLEKLGRARAALEICARGLAHCDTTFAPRHIPSFLLRSARLEASRGRIHVAEALLDSVDAHQRLSPVNVALHYLEAEALRARLLFLAGRKPLARRRIEQLYRRFQNQWRDLDGGSLGNLEPKGAVALRNAIHEIEEFTPEQGYRFEMEWRRLTVRSRPSLPRHGTAGNPPWSSGSYSLPSGTHLVYRFAGDALVRWTADAKGIVVDTIPLSAERCLVEVRRALECMQTEPPLTGTYLGRESFARLRALSQMLLPGSLPHSEDHAVRIHISPDGPLTALPFEALPFPPSEDGPPLALTADIEYLRALDHSRPPYNGEVVIVSNPLIPRDFALRYGGTERLNESAAEARDALRRWPQAVTLSGSAATKDSLQEHWPGASIIYLAAHHVRDPGAPFLGFVPLAAPAGASFDAHILESADVRALDLSACRLAVLASCASGAPYRNAVNPGPSLGDAFLDSGASSVVHSFWDVGDTETRDFMRVFLAHWRADQSDAVNLGNARRQFMRTPSGASPRVWAAWSVLTSSP